MDSFLSLSSPATIREDHILLWDDNSPDSCMAMAIINLTSMTLGTAGVEQCAFPISCSVASIVGRGSNLKVFLHFPIYCDQR